MNDIQRQYYLERSIPKLWSYSTLCLSQSSHRSLSTSFSVRQTGTFLSLTDVSLIKRYRDFLTWSQTRPRIHSTYECCAFMALLLQVLAMALQFVPDAEKAKDAMALFIRPTADSKSAVCIEAGESILRIIGRRHPTLSSVEADIMRCAWSKNSGHGLDAWHSLANAIRQAQDLGLHRDPVSPMFEPATQENLGYQWHCEHKRRIWACLLAWDAHMALQLGRPRMVNLSDCTTKGPTNCDAPQDVTRTLLRNQTLPGDLPSHYTSHTVKYEVALLIHHTINNGLLQPGAGKDELIRSIHSQTTSLLSSLSSPFKKPDPDTSWDVIYPEVPKLRLQIQVIVESFLLSLHRPHIFTRPDSLELAVSSAKNVLDLSQGLFELVEENQHKTFTLVFYTIDAGIFLAMALARFRQNSDADGLSLHSLGETLEVSIHRLKFLERFHTVAIAGKEILKDCLSHLRSSSSMSGVISTPSSPSPVPTSQNLPANSDQAFTVDAENSWDFWTTLLNDPASTNVWLDTYLDPSVPNFDPFSDDTLPWLR